MKTTRKEGVIAIRSLGRNI